MTCRTLPRRFWPNVGLGVVLLFVGCSGGGADDVSVGIPDLELVDAGTWIEASCDATSPVLPAMQQGFRLVNVGEGNIDFEAVDEWISETSEMSAQVARDLRTIGAPDTERGVELARAQIGAYESLSYGLRRGAEELKADDAGSMVATGGAIMNASEQLTAFAER